MPRKQHAGRPHLPPDLSPDGFPSDDSTDRPRTLGQTQARIAHKPQAPRAKAFPTLASMPRVPRPPIWDAPDSDDPRPTARRRAASTARPLMRPGDIDTGETEGAWDAPTRWEGDRSADDARGAAGDDGCAGDGDAADDEWNAADQWDGGARAEDWDGGWNDEARGLAAHEPNRNAVALTARPHASAPARRLLARARSPWSLLRVGLAVIATMLALGISFARAGEPSQPFMAFQAHAESRAALNVAQAVKPLTSLKVPEQFDSPAQFALYSPAACSPSAMAEVLTAWGDPHATIGHMIDDLGSYLSPGAGLLDQQGFQVAAAKEGFRADISWSLSYNQILYLTNQLGLPVIVSFRRDWGYYHYFAGGHFITVTGGDQQGLTMVDSSEYYITYLPRDVFLNLWQWRGDGTAQTIVLVPKDYQYALPAA